MVWRSVTLAGVRIPGDVIMRVARGHGFAPFNVRMVPALPVQYGSPVVVGSPVDTVSRVGQVHGLLAAQIGAGRAVGRLETVLRIFLVGIDEATETVSLEDEIVLTAPADVGSLPVDAVFRLGVADVVLRAIRGQVPHLEAVLVPQHR